MVINRELKMINKKQLRKLAQTITQNYDAQKIFLFGSYAYGKPNSSSDLDLCIITNLKKKRKIEVIRDIRKELSSFLLFPLDILIYEENEFNERASLKNTLEHKIVESGILINE